MFLQRGFFFPKPTQNVPERQVLSAPRKGLKKMASRRLAILLGVVAVAFGAKLQQGLSLLDLQPEQHGPHTRFTAALAHVREQFSNITTALSSVEGEENLAQAASDGAAEVPEAIRVLNSGIVTLRRVRTEVAAQSNELLPASVRMQVMWDIDRCGPHTHTHRPARAKRPPGAFARHLVHSCTPAPARRPFSAHTVCCSSTVLCSRGCLYRIVADAERLRTQSLAPLARAALIRALTLRFGVLLTPAFWTTPIKRDLILADDTSGDTAPSTGDVAPSTAASKVAAEDAQDQPSTPLDSTAADDEREESL